MTLKDIIDQNKGICPGFNFLRHMLSISIILFHCRQLVYMHHSAELLATAGVTDVMAAAQAAQNGPVHFTLMEMMRPAFHALLGMFFGLSGFLIAGSAVRTAKIGKFFINRALRIFPALAVETLLSALILGPLVTAFSLKSYFSDVEFRRYFGNIVGWVHFSLPGVFVDNPVPKTVNGQLWTLPLELCCYLFMLLALMANLIKSPKVLLAIGAIAVIVMLALFSYDPITFNPKSQNFFTSWYIVVIFWFGVLFYLNAEMINSTLSIFILCVIFYWATIFFGVLTPLSGIFLTYCTIYIGFIKFPWWDRLVKSDYSYGLFLYHFPIIQTCMYFLGPYWKNFPLIDRFFMIVVLCIPITLAFAATSWRLIEKPALSLRSIFARTPAVVAADRVVDHAPLPGADAIASAETVSHRPQQASMINDDR